jgi:hypothetical protein
MIFSLVSLFVTWEIWWDPVVCTLVSAFGYYYLRDINAQLNARYMQYVSTLHEQRVTSTTLTCQYHSVPLWYLYQHAPSCNWFLYGHLLCSPRSRDH